LGIRSGVARLLFARETCDEAISNAREAIELHLEGLIEREVLISH
jgi:predicted RNase H-like HicB family nuclease